MPIPDPGPAKRRLLELLKRRGPAGAAALASEIGLTDVAVRQHLTALLEDGLVEAIAANGADPKAPRRRGRPSRSWQLTDRALVLFPDRHADLTVGLITAVRAAFGEEGMRRIVDLRAREQEALYATIVPDASAPLIERLEALARQRTEEGYMAEVRVDPGGPDAGFLLIEHHCPICDAAKTCQGLCAAEIDLMRHTLGAGVEVERIEHLMADGLRCVYRIRGQ